MGFLQNLGEVFGIGRRRGGLGPPGSVAVHGAGELDTSVEDGRTVVRGMPVLREADGTMVPAAQTPHRTRQGRIGTAILDGRIYYEEFNPALERTKGYGDWGKQGVWEKMKRTDPDVGRSLSIRHNPLLSAKWVVKPADEQDPLAVEIADFVAWNLFEELNWQAFLDEALDFDHLGFYLFEVIEDNVAAPRSRFPNIATLDAESETVNVVGWSAFEARMPRTIEKWIPNAAAPTQLAAIEQFIGLTQVGGRLGVETRRVDAQHLLRFTRGQTGSNFEGVSVLRPVYKVWKILEMLERLEAIRHERQNVGIPVIKLPENSTPADEGKAEEFLAHIQGRAKAFIVLPPGWEFGWETSGAGQGTNVLSLMQQLRRSIMDNVHAGFMTLGNKDTGSYALADTQEDHFVMGYVLLARFVEAVFNKGLDGISHIRRLVDMNYGPQAAYPKLRAANVDARDLQKIAKGANEAVASGGMRIGPKLDKWFRNIFDIELEDDPQPAHPTLDTTPPREELADAA